MVAGRVVMVQAVVMALAVAPATGRGMVTVPALAMEMGREQAPFSRQWRQSRQCHPTPVPASVRPELTAIAMAIAIRRHQALLIRVMMVSAHRVPSR